jgi:hypothetical protein
MFEIPGREAAMIIFQHPLRVDADPSRRLTLGWAANVALSLTVVGLSVAGAPRLLVGLGLAGLIAGSLELLAPLHGPGGPAGPGSPTSRTRWAIASISSRWSPC